MVNCKAVKEIKLLRIGSSEELEIWYTAKKKKKQILALTQLQMDAL